MSDFKAKISAELDTSKIEQQIDELNGKKIKLDVDTGDTSKEVQNVNKQIVNTRKSTQSFGDTLKKSFNIGAAASLTAEAFDAIRTAADKATDAIKDIDGAVTDLRMATNGSYGDTFKLVQGYNKLGQRIGAITTEVSDSADAWLRQGHSISDTNTLIRDSMMLSKIANLDAADSTQYLTSTMKGYKYAVDDVVGIIDKYVSVDLVSATNAGGLAEATSRTAVSANNAGVGFEKLLGYVAVVGEVTQKSMSSVGESFKTIFTRMADIKAGKLELVDEDGTVESLSDVETVLNNMGIKLRESNNEFRNFGDVLDEVAAAWDSYSSVQQAAISKAFAGTRQSENFKVLMENYSSATSYMEAAMNSAGTAEQKFNAYLDSIEAKTKSLQAAFESLAVNTFSTELFGGIIDATTALVAFLDKSNTLKGTLAGLAGAGAIKAFAILKTGIASAAVRMNEFNAALNLVKAGNIGASQIQQLAQMTSHLSQSQLKAVISSQALSTQQRIAILTAQGMTTAEAQAALASMGLATAEGAATTATFTLNGALKGLWATIKANPYLLIIAGIFAAVTALSNLKDAAAEAAQAAKEAARELKDSFSADFSKISGDLSTLKGLESEFDKLSKGVDDYGNNVSLTADEYERYKEIVQTILGISPSLISGYDDEGNAIANKNGLLAQSIALMEEEQRLKRQELTSDDNLWTIAKGSATEIQEAYDEIKSDFIDRKLYKAGTINKGDVWTEQVGRGDYLPAVISSITGANYDDLLTDKNYADYAEEIVKNRDRILQAVKTPFTKGDITFDAISDSYYDELEDWLDNLEDYCRDAESISSEFSQYLQIVPQGLTDYYTLDATSKDFLAQWIRSKDFDITKDTTQGDIEAMKAEIEEFTKYLASDEDLQLVIEAGLKLNTDSKSKDITVKEYKEQIASFIDSLDGIDEDVKVYIKSTFGIEGDESQWSEEVDEKVGRVQNILKNEYDDSVLSLSMSDLEIAYKISADKDSLTWEELLAFIDEYKRKIDPTTFDSYLESAKSYIGGISDIRSILDAQSTGSSISVEDFNSEELKDYTSALEYHNGVLQLNADKVNEIVQAKAEETIATNNANKAMAQSEYLNNAAQIEKLRKKIQDKNFAENESTESVQADIDALLARNDILKQQCDSYDLITASLEEATSAYQNWLNAQNASQSGDMFDDTLDAINHINDTLNNKDSDLYGRVGRTDYQAAIDLIIPDTVNSEDKEAVNKYLDEIHSMFTYDEDGNRAGLNIENFCQKAIDSGLMVLNEAGTAYEIAGGKTMEDFAEGMNLSLPLVQAMFGEMEEFGGKFSWADEANKTIGDLAVSANVAAENLRTLHGVDISLDDSNLDNTIKQMQDLKGTFEVDSSDYEYANSIISYCVTQKQMLEDPAILNVDTSKLSDSAAEAVSLMQEFKTAYNNLELKKSLGLDTTDAQAEVDALMEQISSSENDYLVSLSLDSSSVEALNTSITSLDTPQILTTFNIDETALLDYQPEDKQATVTYNVDTTAVDRYNPQNLKRYVNYYVRTFGSVDVNGTAHAGGTAMAGGNWGTAKGGETLTGELGREIVVDPHTGRWYTVGDRGAEFVNIPKGAIVFNHKQTESLLKNGYVAGRASALVSGTAMVTGGMPVSGAKDSTTSGGNKTSNYKKGSTSNSHSTEDELEVFDWIEVAIDRIERAVDRLKTTATSAYKALKTKLGATYDEISKVNEEIAVQGLAYERYMEEANSVGLSSDLASKVQDGTINLSEYDSETQELIKDYQEWYEKALDCSDAIQQLHEDLGELYENNFNNVASDYENQLSLFEHMTNSYNTGLQALEAQGYLQGTEYYSALQDVERQKLSVLNAQLAALEQSFSEAMSSGEIEKYSDAWYEMQGSINDVKEQIDEANLSLLEYEKTMREIEWDHFDYVQDRISQITDEADFMIELLSNSDLHTDKGQLTDEGMATMGLHAQNYNTHMAQADQYAAEILELNKQIADDPNNTELIERREELLGLQQDSIIAAENEKQAMIDLVREGIELELDAMQELIDAYTDALDSAKDLYDYQRKIKDHTTEIANIQKKLSAYENDFSDETRAKVQQLTVQLEEAQSDLEETEYQQYISDQKKLLDELYLEYETVLNQRLDNTDALLEEMIDSVNSNTDSINSTLTEAADNVGYTMSESMQSIWNGSTEALDGTLSVYGDGFNEKLTAINNVLSQIQANTAAMIANSDDIAEEDISTTNPETEPTPSSDSPETTPTEPAVDTPVEPAEKEITIGGKINAKGAKIYDYAGDNSGENQYFSKDPIYTVLGESNGYLKVRHHKLSSGVTGWFKRKDVKAYKTGGLVDYTGLAQLDGTPTKPELVLNAQDTQNFLALKDTLNRMTQQELSLGTSYGSDYVQHISGITDISKKIAAIRDIAGINTGVTVGDIEINIPIEHVDDYNDFVTQLQKDKQFERFVQSMTVDRLVGGGSLKKNKYFGNR